MTRERMARQEPSIRDLIAELEEGLPIDRNALDIALEQHPDLFYRVSKELALTKSRADAAKQAIEEAEAIADERIRRDAEINGEQIREKIVEGQKALDPKVKAARERYLSLRADAGLLEALSDSFTARSHALRDLVALYTAGYFGGSVRGAAADLNDSRAERVLQRRAEMTQERRR